MAGSKMAWVKNGWVKNGWVKNGLGQKRPGQIWPGQKWLGQKWHPIYLMFRPLGAGEFNREEEKIQNLLFESFELLHLFSNF